jgi:hypothetical protein
MCIERIEGGKVKDMALYQLEILMKLQRYILMSHYLSHQQILKDINKIFFSISIIEHIVINTLLYHHITRIRFYKLIEKSCIR